MKRTRFAQKSLFEVAPLSENNDLWIIWADFSIDEQEFKLEIKGSKKLKIKYLNQMNN